MDRNAIRSVLNQDPGWSAYALADLDPAYQENCVWSISGAAAALIYNGLEPPVLFAVGPDVEVESILATIPPGRYEYMLLEQHFALLGSRLQVESKTRMWRMILDVDIFIESVPDSAIHLTSSDVDTVEELMAGKPGAPDAYHPSQLNKPGVFYGLFADEKLVALAGTHIVSHSMSVAAIGNIFVHPAFRGKGLCYPVTQAVTAHLVRAGLETIVLNVSMSNTAAIRCYEKVGFIPHCQYLEGKGHLSSSNRDILGQ